MKYLHHFFVLIVFGISALSSKSEEITWAMQDFPPVYMPIDGKPGDGINDSTLRSLIQALPGVEHKFIVANAARIYAKLDAGESICFLGGLRTPEREKLYYLADVQLAPPLQLIARKQIAESLPLNADGQVNLTLLLNDTRLRGLLVSKRSYGVAIDEAIANRPKDARVEIFSSANVGGNFFDMLRFGRADYTIDYDFMLAYRQFQTSTIYDGISTFPIQGNTTPTTIVVVCPRTPWGRESIMKIDRALADLATRSGLGLATSRWYTIDTIRNYAPAMKAFNLKRRNRTDSKQFPQDK